MNKLVMRILPAAALGSVLLLSGTAWSMGHKGEFDSERMMAHMADRLELSETQEQQVGELLSQGAQQAKVDHERMREIREALKEQRHAFNAGETQKLADELGEISSRMAFQLTSKHAEVYKLLTDEQRQEMDEMAEKRESRHRR